MSVVGSTADLRGLEIRDAALEPPGDQNIDPRGKAQSKRRQHRPRVQAQIEWSLDVVAGVHRALLPVRRRERPCAGNYILVLRISPAASRKSGPVMDMHDQSASRTCGRMAVTAMSVRALRIGGPLECGRFTRDE